MRMDPTRFEPRSDTKVCPADSDDASPIKAKAAAGIRYQPLSVRR